MTYNKLTPSQSVIKAYLKEPVNSSDLFAFRQSMQTLLKRINPSESEEFNKNLVAEFLNQSLYIDRRYMVNTYQRTDLAIYSEVGTSNEHPVVLFEFKGPSRPDMVTKEDLKKKALYELILYYIREEKQKQNTDIKHLIITNCWEYFVFEKKVFYHLFARDNRFVRNVLEADASNNTDYVYNEIIKPKVEQVENKLQFTYLDLRQFATIVNKDVIVQNKQFISAYKLLSPIHLLKLPFKSDHNTLNKNFYKELLYIMGVEEVIEDNIHKIKRLNDNRQNYSLLEQAYTKLEDYPEIDIEDKCFETALGLVLTWVNRILFLKLLESQLKEFDNVTNSGFLDEQHIKDYDVLHDLFFKVLAKPIADREEELKEQFPNVPYLNSSLFELSKLEQEFIPISGIRLGNISIYEHTVLKDGKGKRITGEMNVLQYLFNFLDSYDFGSKPNSAKELVREDSKTLINASVLGLIFEKINGYKDGSFFTPGYITHYICQKTIREAVVEKFNKLKGWKCSDFEDLKENIDYGNREARIEANEIINSIRICDPAVGSGHFLVSALNELIAIKSELSVLQDRQERPKRIKDYNICVEYDELVISDEDGDEFKYNPSDSSSQKIQETLFEEKRNIIENCLFGVDLNPKSVEICRLRLWIELLKNAYYYRDESGNRILQTLPNIDINIKCGNSLASNHPVCIGRKIQSLSGMKSLVIDYKKNVKEYKQCNSKVNKKEISRNIEALKRKLNPPVQLEMFKSNKLTESKLIIMKDALEWMIEFPEILSEEGTFEGFDVIIGNPPYISLEKLPIASPVYESMRRIDEDGNVGQKTYNTHNSRGDIYALFIERGLHLLRKGGRLSYIIPNKWEKVMYGRQLRDLFLKTDLTQLIDFGDFQIFEDATTYTSIIRMRKDKNSGLLDYSLMKNINPETLNDDIEEYKKTFETQLMDNGIWTLSSYEGFKRLKECEKQMPTLGEYVGGEEYYGIKTGLTKAFNISIEKANELIEQDKESANIIRPFLQGRGLKSFQKAIPGSYLIYTPKGFTAKGMGIDREKQQLPDETTAWEWFKNKYPAISEWLLPFKEKAKKRTDKGDYWWELRACAYYDKFAEPKIFYQVFQTKSCFVYDDTSTFCNNSMYFLSVPDKALLTLLCSRVGWWLIREYCPRIQNGAQLIWDNFSQIPVPRVLSSTLSEYAEKMMNAINDEETFSALSKEVDAEVCKLYGLNLDTLCI